MSIVVSDTSPLRALVNLGLQNILVDLFDEVVVPPAVRFELAQRGIWQPVESLVVVRTPSDHDLVDQLRKTLDAGESEAIALAIEMKVTTLLMDEAAGRIEVLRRKLQPVGVLSILARAKDEGLVPLIAPEILRLPTQFRFFVSDQLVEHILKQAGEA